MILNLSLPEMKKWTGCKCVGDADAEVLPDKEVRI